MNELRQDNTIAIISIVLGSLGLLLSLIPCIGFLSVPLGLIGLILGAVAFFKARDNGDKKTMSIVALCISAAPLLISLLWYFVFTSSGVTGYHKIEYDNIHNCDSLLIKIEQLDDEIAAIERELESNENGAGVFGNITKVSQMAINLAQLQDRATVLGCDFSNSGVIAIDTTIVIDTGSDQ